MQDIEQVAARSSVAAPRSATTRPRAREIAQLLVADIQPLQNVSVTRYLREQLKLPDADLCEWLRAWIGRGLGALEELLGHAPESGDYCIGGAPTLADACLIPQCYSSRRFGVEPELYPRIARIERHCRALAAFQKAAPEQQPDANN
jgi:maleylacetoacetate isomerase